MVTLGPLTNLALAVTRKPSLAAQVGRCVVMGGAPCCEGNVTPAAEYNIWVDPEAARIVMLSGLPVELVGWQTCRGDAVLNEADITQVLGFNNRAGPLCRRVQQPGTRGLQGTDWRGRHLVARSGGHERCARSDDRQPVERPLRGGRNPERTDAGDDGCGSSQRGGGRTESTQSGRTLCEREARAKVCWTIDNRRWKEALFAALQ